jgi:hypothetical protein
MKILLDPPFPKGEVIPPFTKREVRRDFINLFSENGAVIAKRQGCPLSPKRKNNVQVLPFKID